MELKIICQCGQKYKFDVEPVNGRMPFTVKCPICGLDGTTSANTMLAGRVAAPPMAAAPPPAYQATPPPPVPAYAAPPPPAMAGLRINKEAPSVSPVAFAVPPPIPTRPPVTGARAAVKSLVKEPGEYNLMRGILGAFIGSAVGCGLMYGFFLWAQFRFPLTGCAVGAAAGYMARLMARGTDNTLGFIAAGIAVASVSGTFVAMYGEFPITAIVSIVVSASMAYRISSG